MDASCKFLIQAIQKLSFARSVSQIMKIVGEESRKIANSDGVTFVLKDKDKCYYADECAISPLWKGQRFPMKDCISGWAMLNKKPAVIPDIYLDSRIPSDAYRPTFVKSLTMVPIRTMEPIGAIGNYWSFLHVSSEYELELLQALADATSVAMENVRLYTELEGKICELQVAMKNKDEFLMILSHELKTPMSSILGWSQLLMSDPSASDLSVGIETIQRNAKLQVRIIDDLLDTARIISGKMSIEKHPLDLEIILKSAVDTFSISAADKGIKIFTKFNIKESTTIIGDPDRLHQVIWNLLNNSLKFTPPGGKIEVLLSETNQDIIIKIRDTGEGLDPHLKPHIFERFRQGDSSSSRKHGGLGIGLSLVKYFVEAHGGRIEANSRGSGQGTQFTVRIPIWKRKGNLPSPSPSKQKNLQSGPLSGVRILAVDDDPDTRTLLKVVLARKGALVLTASGGEGLIKTMKEFKPDVLICDLGMPGEDGISVIKKIRAEKQDSINELPAIAFTAFSDREHESQAKSAGFDAFVAKPLQENLLTQTVLNLHKYPHQDKVDILH